MSLKLCVLNICLMTLIVLSVEGRAFNLHITYDKAKEMWTKKKCVFPDLTKFQTSDSLLEPCNETNTNNSTDIPMVKVCETFFKLSIQMCYAISSDLDYANSKLKPEILDKALDFTHYNVCLYATNLNFPAATYLGDLRNYTQCSLNCLSSPKTKPICELLISSLCSFFGQNLCQPMSKKDIAQPTLTSSTTNGPFVNATPSEKTDTKNVVKPSDKDELEGTTNTTDRSTEKVIERLPISDLIQTTNSIPDSAADKTTTKYDSKLTQKPNNFNQTDRPLTNIEKPKDQPTTSNLDQADHLLTNSEKPKGELTNSKKEEVTGGSHTTLNEDDSYDGFTNIDSVDSQPVSGGDGAKNQESGPDDSKKKVENVYTNPQSTGDDEEGNGSGHFLAYFLTAVVICIAGYVIYHNKQKIMAFIIEGRSSHSGRQRSKGVKYTELKSNVEEILPSLEKSATTKNFVY